MRNKLLRYSSAIGAAFAIIWLGAWSYCYSVGSRIPIEESNRIYGVNYHGTLLYLNKAEYVSLYAIPVVFFLIGIVSAIVIKIRTPQD